MLRAAVEPDEIAAGDVQTLLRFGEDDDQGDLVQREQVDEEARPVEFAEGHGAPVEPAGQVQRQLRQRHRSILPWPATRGVESNAAGGTHGPHPWNEPTLTYAPGTPERPALKTQLQKMASEVIEITPRIGGKAVKTGKIGEATMPHDHRHVLATWHKAGAREVEGAIAAALGAHPTWSRMAWADRAAIFLKAADLLAGPWRHVLNAATMLGQSKTAHQAEIDSACELIDFLRFNVALRRGDLPAAAALVAGRVEPLEYRPLEGFVFAVTPFNFTAIGGNLPTAPALMGNTVVWKPASTAIVSAHYIMELLEDGGTAARRHQHGARRGGRGGRPGAGLAGPRRHPLHRLDRRRSRRCGRRSAATSAATASYPRIVGETGGKDFVFAHPSADVGRAGHRAHARRLRVPGPEVLGGLARLRAGLAVAGGARRAARADRPDQDGRRPRLHATSWAR